MGGGRGGPLEPNFGLSGHFHDRKPGSRPPPFLRKRWVTRTFIYPPIRKAGPPARSLVSEDKSCARLHNLEAVVPD